MRALLLSVALPLALIASAFAQQPGGSQQQTPGQQVQQQTAAQPSPSQTEFNILTDARIGIVKAVLQLTPEQAKYWPAVEEAIRARAQTRYQRIAAVAERLGQQRAVVTCCADAPMPWHNEPPDSKSSPMRGSRSIRASAPTRSSGCTSLRSMSFVS